MKILSKLGIVCATLAAGLHFVTTPLHASLIAYEGFNYTNAVGASIGGLNGGTGWIAAYPAPSGTIILTNNLTYPGVYTSGKAMRFQGNANMQNGGRKWTNSLPNGTYWYSFLINPLTVATGGSGTEPSRGTFCPLIRTNQNQDGVGIRLDNNAGSPQFKALIAGSGPNLEFPGGYDKAYYIIGKAVINITGSTTNVSNTIWVYQSPAPLPATEAGLTGAPTSTVVDTGGAAVAVGGGLGGRAFGTSAPIPYDEVRIGEAFADVLPPAQLVWNGDGTANLWDNQLANTDWLLGATATYFATGNYVSFTDASTNQAVSINEAVQPTAATVDSTKNYVFGGANGIVGSASLVKSGFGTLTLNNTNTFTGGVTVSGGILVVATNEAAGSGLVSLNSGGTRLVITDGLTLTNSITFNGGGGGGRGWIENSEGGTGNATLSGVITIAGAKSAGGYFGSSASGTLTIASPVNVNHAAVASFIDSVRLGTVIFSGGGSYTNFGITDGTARLGADNGLCSNAVVNIGTGSGLTYNGVLDLAGHNQTVGGITKGGGSASATIGNSSTSLNSTLTVKGPYATTYSGAIVDTLGSGDKKVGLTVTGGTLTLSGGNSYTGDTTVSGGLLLLDGTGSLSSGTAVTVSGGGGLGGPGTVGGNVAVNSGGRVYPGGVNTLGNALYIAGNYTLSNGNTNYFEVGNGAADNIYVGGTCSASGTTVIDVNGLGNQVETTYQLISFASGTPAIGNFTLVAHGDFGTLTPSLQMTANSLNLVLQNISAPLTWRGDGSANAWNLSTSSTNWLNNNTLLLTYFKNSDTVTFDDSAVNLTANVTATVIPGSVSVNSANNFTFSGAGKLSGGAGLTKDGTGTLTINTTNDNTAGVIINNGVVKMGNGGALGNGPLTLNSGGTLDVNGNNFLFPGDFYGLVNSSAGTPTITVSNNTALPLSGSISNSGGALSVLKLGSGDLTLSNPNPFSGGTTISNGAVVLAASQTLGSGTITLAAGSKRLALNDGVTLNNSIVIAAGSGVGNSGQGLIQNPSGSGNATVSGGTIYYNGTQASGGVFSAADGGTLTIASPIISAINIGNGVRKGTVVFSGGGYYPYIEVGNGTLMLGAQNGLCTTSMVQIATTDAPSTSYLDLAGFDQTLGGFSTWGGAYTAYIGNSSISRDSTLTTVATSTFSGTIQDTLGVGDHKLALTVAGGSLTLSGANSFTGNTTVNGGKLLVTGSLGNSVVAVSGTGVLGGTGTVGGNTAVSGTGTLAPGTAGTGTLTFSGDLALSGKAVFELNRSANPSNDLAVVTGALTGGGTLTVTNVGGALALGNTFVLFSKPVSGFTDVVLPTLGSGLAWTNSLANDGSITVVQGIPSTPTNITYTVTGGNITIAWPPSYAGWILQSQTNQTGLSNNWHDLWDSTNGASMMFPIDPANPSVFFRLRHP